MRRSLYSLPVVLSCFGSLCNAQVADPAPGPVLAYEGRLMESGGPVNGVHSFSFTILGANGTELWASGQRNLIVSEGLYGVVLGSAGMPAFPQTLTLQADLHVHVSVDGLELTPDAPLIPSLQASTAWNVIGNFAGDVTGTQRSISVEKLRGRPLDPAMSPSAGQVLLFDGSSWIASSISTAAGSQGPVGPQGPQGLAGLNGLQGLPGIPAAIPSTILSGISDPISTVGIDGDFFINTALETIAGPKKSGSWPIGVSLTGTQGTIGLAGATGVIGPTGAAGAVGPVGLTGAAGTTGPNGATGAAGAIGSTGLTGAAGLQGQAGAQGPTGATGSGFSFAANFSNPKDSSVYFIPPNSAGPVPTAANHGVTGSGDMYVGSACTVRSLLVRALVTITGSTDSTKITIQKNDVATSMTCTVASLNVLGAISTCQDTTDTFTVAAGDVLEFQYTQTSGTPNIDISTLVMCN